MTAPPYTSDDGHIVYGKCYASYVRSISDRDGDPDPYPDIELLSGSVKFESVYDSAGARPALPLPATPRTKGVVISGDTYEVKNSNLVDKEGREGVWLVLSVDDIPLTWRATVTLTDERNRVLLNAAYIVTEDVWEVELDGRHVINLPDLIPNPGALTPVEGSALRAAQQTLDEIRVLKGLIDTSKIEIDTSESSALTYRNQAQGFRNEAETFKNTATTQAGLATTAKTAAETARTGAETARTGAEKARTGAETAKADIDVTHNHIHQDVTDAETHALAADASASDASASAGAAATAKDEAETARTGAETARTGAEKAKSDTQFVYGLAETAILDFETDFNAKMAAFASLQDDINAVATTVAVDANRAEDAAQATEDALTVVRAHRWVPQGEWEYDLDYSAGDVVAHDGGSYYAQVDIPAGVEPPGGNWMVLGQGGITDAAELTGALTEYVDSSQTIVNLGSYVPGVEPELHAAQLVAILGYLYLGLESSVEASRVTGALTDQVDASGATVPDPSTEFATQYPLGTFVQEMVAAVSGFHDALVHYAPLGHLHDGADISGALTAQVNVGEALFAPTGDAMEHMTILEFVRAMISEFGNYSRTNHKHPVGDLTTTGTASSSTYLRGDGTWATPTNTTYSVPSQAEAEAGTATTGRAFSAQRVRQAANAAIAANEWFGTQAQYDSIGTKDPNRTYNILEG